MDYPEVTFHEDGLYVSIWVGTFGSQDAVDEYLMEQYEDDRDDEPLSPFAADVGLKFYDHDFIESNHESNLSSKGADAFAQHSYGESFATDAWAATQRRNIDAFDTVFLLYGYNHVRYPQSTRPPRRVSFVGTFPYREK